MFEHIHKNQLLYGLIIGAIIIGLFTYFFNVTAKTDSFSDKKIELSSDSSYLFSKDFNPDRIKVYGVAIGDPRSLIDSGVITEENNAGWVHTTQGVGYRISNGKVVEIVLSWDETKRMGLLREDEIYIRFGKPDKVEDGSFSGRDYYYIDKGLIVRYADNFGISINILGKTSGS